MVIKLSYYVVLFCICMSRFAFTDELDANSTVAIDAVELTSPSPTPSTSPSPPTNEINCIIDDENNTHIASVKIVNATTLFDFLTPQTNGNKSTCILVLFYYPWCPFSAQTGASYNGLGQLYPRIHVLALNAYHHNSINMRFGLVGIPSILFFNNGKMIAKFNNTEPTKESLFAFIKHVSGLEPDSSINITELDWSGPVPTVPEPITDYVLALSSLFLFFAIFYVTIKSTIFKKLVESVRNTWREAEAHQHMD